MRFSTRFILYGIICISLSLAVAGGAFYLSTRRIILADIRVGQLEMARRTMREADRLLYKAYLDIQAIADDAVVEIYLERGRRQVLAILERNLEKKLLLTGPWYNLMVADVDGRIVAGASGIMKGRDVRSNGELNAAFEAALKGKVYHSDLVISPQLRRPTVIFAAPILGDDDGKVKGVALGGFAWPVILQLFDEIGTETEAHLINRAGVIIGTRTIHQEEILKEKHPGFLPAAISTGEAKEDAGISVGGLHRDGVMASWTEQEGYLGYRGNGWRLFLETDLDYAMAPIHRMFGNLVIIVLLILIALTAGVFVLGRRFSRPVESLTRQVTLLGRGDLTVRAKVESGDEIGQLAGAFNRMVEDLGRITVSRDSLRESEEKYRVMVETANDAIWTFDVQGNFIFMNRQTETISGFKSSELIGKSFAPLVYPDDLPVAMDVFQKTLAGTPQQCAVRFYGKNREIIIVSVNTAPVYQMNEISGIVNFARDITESERTAQALKASEEKYRILFTSSGDALMTIEPPSWRFTSGNPVTVKMFDVCDEAAFTALGPRDVSPEFQPDGRPSSEKAAEMIQTAMAKGSHLFEWIHRRLGGESFPATVLLTRMEIGGQTQLQASVRDITERKALENGLRNAYEDLKNIQAQLVQSGKLSSIGELASGVAHELNQPLMVIRGTAQLIERAARNGNLTHEELLTQLEPINRNTKRMMRIINHLKNFSRQSEMDFQPVEINHVIEECFLLIGEQLKLRDIAVERNLATDLPRIRGDANQLEQVFVNLVANSRDAVTEARERAAAPGREGAPGGIKITTRVGHGNFVEISVTDTGGGIPADKVSRIFDPFFTTKAVGKGTGLGLSISFGIIKDHGGEIDVAETGPEGTTMRLLLPAME
jgi:histidine kinase